MDTTCPSCGKELGWNGDSFEWFCHACGDVFTDDELDEERARIEAGE